MTTALASYVDALGLPPEPAALTEYHLSVVLPAQRYFVEHGFPRVLRP